MFNTKLSKAITMALAGTALAAGSVSVASAASTTMYNMSGAGTTDPFAGGTYDSGGLYHGGFTDGFTNGAAASNTPTGSLPTQEWAGTSSPTTAAFGYTGAHLNWGAEFTGGGSNSATISAADSFAHYGKYADIDTAKGAWSDQALGDAAGWRHDLDLGLFKTDTDGQVTLSVSGITQTGTDFGISVFDGVDTVTNYNHHGAWTSYLPADGTDANFSPFATRLPSGTIIPPAAGALNGTQVVASSDSAGNNLNTLTFDAIAGHTYSIFIGGYRNGAWGDTVDGYQLGISQSTSPVPVPAAAWLFGSAMLSLLGVNRRKLTRKG